MSFAELTAEVLKDRQYYEMSGGGVTFSGGEPTVQGDFLTELLTAYRKKGISTALETSGFCPVEKFSAIVRLCDIVLFDVKQTDGETHKLFTGAENRVILENLCNTASVTRTIVRVPLIPGFNNNKDFYTSLAQLLKDTAVSEVHLLPYHRLGSGKYRQLDRRETCTGIQKLTDKEKNNALDTITRLLDIPVFLY
jgi:pyruvate formate lyase activating enzyme